jgi:hypothetical protein
MFIAGNYEDVVAMEMEEENRKLNLMKEKQKNIENESEESEYESEESECVYDLTQTFPTRNRPKVVMQGDDLTCGMRTLQNLFHRDFVNREEMDNKAIVLESLSNGIPMYDKRLGYYSIEVLKAIINDKGKYVQRIALDKIKKNYFEKVVASTPLFQGYIVTIGNSNMKHYVAIQYNNGEYVIMDSLSGSSQVVPVEALFQTRRDGHIYCSQDISDVNPVVAVLAVGGSPFIEYYIMHQTWSDISTLVSPKVLTNTIQQCLEVDYNLKFGSPKINEGSIKKWLTSLRVQRSLPPDDIIGYFQHFINDHLQTKQILVKKGTLQTIVHCREVGELMKELKNMGWVTETQAMSVRQNNVPLCHQNGQEMNIYSNGTFNQYLLDVNKPLLLLTDNLYSLEASVGGFYTFNSSVSGECVEKNQKVYSVRDGHGSVHVLHANAVQEIRSFNNN